MKYVASLSLATLLVLGATAAQAQPTDNSEAGMVNRPVVGSDYWGRPHHPCVGLASGTADPSCGTLTGGPSGSLF